MIKTSFERFRELSVLQESVQAAKDYLLKRYATKHEIRASEIKDDIKKKILGDPNFIKLRDMTQKSPAYAPLFVKFFFDQKATMENLEEIWENLEKYKQNLGKDLSMPVIEYGKIEPTEEDHRPGWEILGDELRNIPRKIKLRKLYSELTAKMRKEFAKATDTQIDKLTEISNQLDKLPNKDGRNAWDNFTQNMKKYEDIRTYPEYKDTKAAFSDMIKDADLFIETWVESDDEIIKKLKSLGAQVGFLYNKDKYVVISTRTSEALRAVAGDTTFCIKNDSTFWSYGGGRVQLVVLNRNLPTSDLLSLCGITVNKDQTVYTDANRTNSRLPVPGTPRTLTNTLEAIGLPKSAIDKIVKEFPQEADIKIATEQFFRNKKNLTPVEIMKSLLVINKGVLAGTFSRDEWEKISGVVALIMKDSEGLKNSDFIKWFKEYGILSDSGFNIFSDIIGDKYTKEDIKEIYEVTLDSFENISAIIDARESEDDSYDETTESEMEKLKEVYNNRSSVIGRLKEKI